MVPPPLAIAWDELEASPDACSWRLLELAYEFFGLGPEAMPPEFNQQTRRLELAR